MNMEIYNDNRNDIFDQRSHSSSSDSSVHVDEVSDMSGNTSLQVEEEKSRTHGIITAVAVVVILSLFGLLAWYLLKIHYDAQPTGNSINISFNLRRRRN